MTPEENKKREQDEHVKYIKEHLCDKDAKKPFVFISYKSDDWKIVLHDIVYTLVKDYGLNVYFDGSFDSHNSLWINQFPENMKNYNCKGVLAFLDNKYATSYATLLELMYSQTSVAENVPKKGLPVVPINLDTLTGIDGEEGERDTGLGLELYEDNTRNVNAKTEEKLFNKTFKELVKRKILEDAEFLYEEGGTLNKRNCSRIVAELVAYLRINENHYEEGKSLDGIVGSIKDACGKEVFSEKSPESISELPQEEPKTLDWSQFEKVKAFQYKDKVYNVSSPVDAYAKLCELLCDARQKVNIIEAEVNEKYIELKNGKKAKVIDDPIGVFKKYKNDIDLYAEQQPDAENVPAYEQKIFEKPAGKLDTSEGTSANTAGEEYEFDWPYIPDKGKLPDVEDDSFTVEFDGIQGRQCKNWAAVWRELLELFGKDETTKVAFLEAREQILSGDWDKKQPNLNTFFKGQKSKDKQYTKPYTIESMGIVVENYWNKENMYKEIKKLCEALNIDTSRISIKGKLY